MSDETAALSQNKVLLGICEHHENYTEAVKLYGNKDALIARIPLGLTAAHHPVTDELVGTKDQLWHNHCRDKRCFSAESSIREGQVLDEPDEAIITMERGVNPSAKREVIVVIHQREKVNHHGALAEVDNGVERDEFRPGRHSVAKPIVQINQRLQASIDWLFLALFIF